MATGKRGTITALAPWFGAKRTLAARIVDVLGPHRAYWEPFCGSMAVLLSKPESAMETVNDLHGDLVNLARVVRDEDLSARLYWRLRRTLPSEAFFRESQGVIRREPAPAAPKAGAASAPDVTRAYHYFLASWLGMNGVAGTPAGSTGFCRRFTSRGGDPGGRFLGAVESLPAWHERLRAVVVLSGDGIGLCEKVEDRDGTVIYADPPYLKKGAEYVHDFAPEDHERLARALCRFRETRCVVSYYDHPELERLYPGWERLPLDAAKSLVNTGAARGRRDAPEVLLVNRPAAAPSLLSTEARA